MQLAHSESDAMSQRQCEEQAEPARLHSANQPSLSELSRLLLLELLQLSHKHGVIQASSASTSKFS